MGRITRTSLFWMALIALSIATVQLTSTRGARVKAIDYTEFTRHLQNRNVDSVQVIDGAILRGHLRQPMMVGQTQVHRFSTRAPVKDSEELIKVLESSGAHISATEAPVSVAAVIMTALPWVLFIAFFIFITRQMQASGNKAFQFGKSKARMLNADTPKITFDDVAGADEAKADLQEIVEFLKDPKKFSRLGGRIPKGALLVGPPGTGKTLLARAVAGEAGRPFFSMSGSDFVEMFVGVGASRVRDLFEQGKAHAPCIIFIDEIDAVGRHRGAGLGGGHDEREQTLNQLLVEMDGFEGNDGVILIAATNRPDVLDPALLRPGRFDRQIVVDAPDLRGREGILKVHMKKVPLGADVDVGVIARGTPGMAGADLANLVNEAALLAARRGRDKVFMADFEDAKDKVMMGAERRSYVMKDEERRLTAYHEAGHALCTVVVPGNDPLHKVTIIPRGRALGMAFTLPEDDRVSITRRQLKANLVMTYGGRAAEELIFGNDRVTTGASGDIQQATRIARRYVTQWGLSEAVGPVAIAESEQEVFLGRDLGSRREVSEKTAELVDAEVARVLNEALDAARVTLREHESSLHAIANALLERETLTRDEVVALAEGRVLPPLQPLPEPGPPDLADVPTLPERHPKPSGGVEGLTPRLA
ncbi:ATP-dependent zinc metalloprotease FtsH [Longimicrobium sp.]|jgi:cell division protease FtsH|uniref:ATP-dependent zinc metalloprotease FtsH n=1 Tax=Longimicrobium sp. TaxID=2029185 RepID=UPI0039C91B16